MYKHSALQSRSSGMFPSRVLFKEGSWGANGPGVAPLDARPLPKGCNFGDMDSAQVCAFLLEGCEAFPMDPAVGELDSGPQKPASGARKRRADVADKDKENGDPTLVLSSVAEVGAVKRPRLDDGTPMLPDTPPRQMRFQEGALPNTTNFASPVSIPTRRDALGPLKVGSYLAKGSSGVVKRVEFNGKSFAEKSFQRCRDPEKSAAAEFEAMGRVPKGMDVPAVLLPEGRLVLPLAHGGDLYRFIEKLAANEKAGGRGDKPALALLKIHWMIQLFRQHLLLQEEGKAHRDMKSLNILMYDALNVSYADFQTVGPLAEITHKEGTVGDMSPELLAKAIQEYGRWTRGKPLPLIEDRFETFPLGKIGLELVMNIIDAGTFFAQDPRVQAFRESMIKEYKLPPELVDQSWTLISNTIRSKRGFEEQKFVQLRYLRRVEMARKARPVPGPDSPVKDQLIHLMLQCMALDPTERPDTPTVLARLNALYQLQLAELGLEDSPAVTQRCADASRMFRAVNLP